MSLQISSTSALNTPSIFLPAPFSSCPNSTFKPAKTKTPTKPLPSPWLETRTRGWFSLDVKTDELETSIDGADELVEIAESRDTLLFSFSRLSLLLLAALPSDTFLSSLFISHQDRSSRSAEPVHLRSQSLGFLCLQFGKTRRNLITKTGTVRSLFGPFVELVKSWNLPEWLVHWGHPGNMAVVLFAMGGYGTYLGYRIRYSDDVEEKANAKDLHPKLLGAMFFFFALGAPGGITSLLTSDKPIFESPHAVTGFIGLSLLTIQTILPVLFEGNPGLRNVHGILGSGIMALFLIHAALGLQLGLSY